MTIDKLIESFRGRQRIYQCDPIAFATEIVGFEPDEWQVDTLRDLADPECRRVSVRSGQGVGKTGVEAIATLWFLSCFPFARVVATAPTRQQLNDVLWAEIAKWQAKSPLLSVLLKWTKTYVYMVGMEKRWFAVARTATKPENMQGFHEENMLFIIDEASGVTEPIMEAVLGTLSGSNNKLLMCGNPTKTSGTFYDSHTNPNVRPLYRSHRVSSRDVKRTDKENIAMLERRYGKDSNVVRVRVDGEFPLQEDDVFIPIALVEQSIKTEYTPREVPSLVHIGCDVARVGSDKTVIGYKVDELVTLHKKRQGQDTMKTADDIILLGEQLVRRYKLTAPIPIKIDDGGVGGGVVDRLRQVKRLDPQRFWWMEIYPVKFGERIRHKYYHDSTTYMMAVVKKLLSPFDEETGKPKPVELVLPNDDDLVGQLSGRKYELTEASKIRIESKEAVKKRGLPSPDEADCVLLLCLPVKPPKRREVKQSV
jgi:hypothetical protein